MTLYGVVLFLHIVFAILLVGGSAWSHLTLAHARRAETSESAQALIGYLSVFVRASAPLAVLTVAAGLYLTFAGDWWGAGWPAVSLTLFVIAGVLAGAVMDPGAKAAKAAVDAAPAGPITAEASAAMDDPKLTITAWIMTGADLAIVALMTNKPGLATSVAVGAVAVALGAIAGAREARHATVVRTAAPA